MPEPVRIQYVHTDYSHFGPHAGTRRIIDYVDKEAFRVREYAVKKEKHQLNLPFLIARRLTRPWLIRKGMKLYFLEDYVAETRIANHAARDPVDIVHFVDGDHSYQHLRCMLDQRGLTHTRIITTHHQPPEFLERIIRKDTMTLVDHVFLVSPEQKDFFSQFLPDEKISVIELGVSADFYVPAEAPPSREVFRTITVGSHLRDFDTLKEVAKSMQDEAIEFHVVSHSLQPDPAYPNVIVHQGVSDEALLQLYQQSHLLLLTLSEATANSALLEGLACGLPIATNDLRGTRHYLPADERFFLPSKNPDDIVAHLRDLIAQPVLCDELADLAYARGQELAWSNVVKRAEAIYRQVIDKAVSRSS